MDLMGMVYDMVTSSSDDEPHEGRGRPESRPRKIPNAENDFERACND